MRHLVYILSLLFICLSARAQADKERKAIEAQIDAFIASWNRHDFSDMKNYVAEDCDFVNIVGMHWKGRENIQYAHQAYHDEFFKKTSMKKQSITIRFLKPDVSIVHVVWHIGAFNPPDGSKRGDNDDFATMIFVKRKAVWLLTTAENVEVSAQAQPFDPVKIRQQSKR